MSAGRIRLVVAGVRERGAQSIRYYRRYPQTVAPFLSSDIMDRGSAGSSEAHGGYGTIRNWLARRGLRDRVRRAAGLRTILTLRYYATYPERRSIAGSCEDLRCLDRSAHGVNVVGYLYSETGVGQISRNLVESLSEVGFPVAVLPIETHDPARKEDRAVDRLEWGTPFGVNVFQVNADMTFAVEDLLPPAVYDDHYNIGYWAWELDHFPETWQHCFDIYDEIWVFSEFVRKSISKNSPVPVVKIPVSFDITPAPEIDRVELGLPLDMFIVLFVFDARSVIERKNPWATIRAFAQAFSTAEREHSVKLVMKVTNLDSFPVQAARLRAEMREVNGLIVEQYFSRGETYALLGASDVYISLHRSEGFGMTLAEAMALGRPVIGTAYSGNMDFMSEDTSYLIPYELVTLQEDHHPYRKGNVWAQPDVAAAAEALRNVYEFPDQAAARGRAAADYIRRQHDPAVVGSLVADRIGTINRPVVGEE